MKDSSISNTHKSIKYYAELSVFICVKRSRKDDLHRILEADMF